MNLTKHSLVLFCGLSASGMGLAAKADADSFTITPSPPAAITTTLSLGAGDVGTVEQGGVIDVITGNGIEGTAVGVTVNNAGSVTSGDASGISVLGESTVTNSGTATGGDIGIRADGTGNTITNLGTAEGGGYGIGAMGNDNNITNSGQIIGGTAAVYFDGSDNTLTLLAGSNVQGSLDLAGDGGNSLVIGRQPKQTGKSRQTSSDPEDVFLHTEQSRQKYRAQARSASCHARQPTPPCVHDTPQAPAR